MTLTRFLFAAAVACIALPGLSSVSHANKAVGKRVAEVQLLNPERQVFVPFALRRFAPPGRYNAEKGRYLTGELDAADCTENRIGGAASVGSRPCDWLTGATLVRYYLDVPHSERYDVKVWQRAVTVVRYDVGAEHRELPGVFRKTRWMADKVLSNHRVRIAAIAPLQIALDRRQILAAARMASLGEQDTSVLRLCRTSSEGPCSTTDEPEFKIELYDRGSMPSAFIVRIRNLASQ